MLYLSSFYLPPPLDPTVLSCLTRVPLFPPTPDVVIMTTVTMMH